MPMPEMGEQSTPKTAVGSGATIPRRVVRSVPVGEPAWFESRVSRGLRFTSLDWGTYRLGGLAALEAAHGARRIVPLGGSGRKEGDGEGNEGAGEHCKKFVG